MTASGNPRKSDLSRTAGTQDPAPAAHPADGPFPAGRKHSLTLSGHRTSVSLEPAFWDAFRAAAEREGVSINALAARIDRARGTETSLASAIRLYVLASLKDRNSRA